MSNEYYKLDFNSILDDHLNDVKDLTRDSGTTKSIREGDSNSYSFYTSIFNNGSGHYSKMYTFHIIYNLHISNYDYHYDDISYYNSGSLSTNFHGGRYCLLIETTNKSSFYTYIKDNNAIKDSNYDFAVSSRPGWGNWLQLVRTHSYAFSFEHQTHPGNDGGGFSDAQYWGFKDFKILTKTDTNKKISEIIFMVGNTKILELPIDNSNYFYILNTKGYWSTINETTYNNNISPVEETNNSTTIKEVFATDGAFAALKTDGTITCWGDATKGGTKPTDISNVKTIFAASETFTALTTDNKMITWGNTNYDGDGTYFDVKLKKTPQLNRMYGIGSNIHTVKNHNLRQLRNYKFTNSSHYRKLLQLNNSIDKKFIELFDRDTLNSINSNIGATLANNEVTDSQLSGITIDSNEKRHAILDTILTIVTATKFKITSSKLGITARTPKTNTKILKSGETMILSQTVDRDFSNNICVYANLSNINNNITVDLGDNTSFKVTRTTAKSVAGSYTIDILEGSFVIYGKYGKETLTFGGSPTTSGHYSDEDIIILNGMRYFFGGFGTNGPNITDPLENYSCITMNEDAIAYLDKNGRVYCFGNPAYDTASNTDLHSGVIQIISSQKCFAALKDNGSVITWGSGTGDNLNNTQQRLNVKHPTGNQENYYYMNDLLTKNVVDIYAMNGTSSGTMVARKNDGSVVLWGHGIGGGDSQINTDLTLPTFGARMQHISCLYHSENRQNQQIFVGINYKGQIITWHSGGTTETAENGFDTGGNILQSDYGLAGTKAAENNSFQNYTISNLPPVSKIYINDEFVTVILNNGNVAWWGKNTKIYTNSNNTKDNSGLLTTKIFDVLRSRQFVDGIVSTSSTALLDSSGGVVLFGGTSNGIISDIYINTTNTLISDLSGNYSNTKITKMFTTSNNKFVFLRANNTAVLVANTTDDVTTEIYPTDALTMTSKGTSYNKTYIISDIENIFSGPNDSFAFVKTDKSMAIWKGGAATNTINDISSNIVGGDLSGVVKVFSNSCAWCVLKLDETVATWYGGSNTISNTTMTVARMAQVGCDYNHVDYGINGTKNGGNGNGGCVLNGDGSQRILRNVKNIYPIASAGIAGNNSNYGGFIAVINDNGTHKLALWGQTRMSHIYNGSNTVKDGSISFVDVSNNFTNPNRKYIGIGNTYYNNSTTLDIMNNVKHAYKDQYDFQNCEIVKVTVQNVGGNKFVLNGNTTSNSFTFTLGKTYIFDTSDSSNTGYSFNISHTYKTAYTANDNIACVQFLTPGQAKSFMRYTKTNTNSYIYCATNGISMGSLYNPASEPSEFTTLDAKYNDSNATKNIIKNYTQIDDTLILSDASFNAIIPLTDVSRNALLDSLFMTLPTNSFITHKNNLNYKNSVIGLENPLAYVSKLKILNATDGTSGLFEGTTTFIGEASLSDYKYDDGLCGCLRDLSDNVLINLDGNPYGGYNGVSTYAGGNRIIITRTTAKNTAARYDISANYGTITINKSTSNSYYEAGDKVEVNNIEFEFTEVGFFTKGTIKKYTTITVTVENVDGDKFVFNGDQTNTPSLEYGINYKFDQSDATNAGHILRFSSSNSNAASNTSHNTIAYGTPGNAGAFVSFTPGKTTQMVYVYRDASGITMGSLYNPIYINNNISLSNLNTVDDQLTNFTSFPGTFYSGLQGTTAAKATQKNKRRHQALRTIFANNNTVRTLTVNKANLGFGEEYSKPNYKVFNTVSDVSYVVINLSTDSDITDNKGFYSAIEDGQHALITDKTNTHTLKVSRTSSDALGNGIYYVENNDSDGDLFINASTSLTYKNNSSPAGPFKDGDTATINYIPLVFGGIGDGSSTNPAENISKPVLVDTFDTIEDRIQIIPTETGFIGIADNNNVYGWGGNNNDHLPPGDPDGDNSNDDRITVNDISFVKVLCDTVLYVDGNGYPKKMSGSNFSLTSQHNVWWDGTDVSSNLTDLSGVVDIVVGKNDYGQAAILLRNDGSVAYWSENGQPSDSDKITFFSEASYPLLNSSHANFSKIIKIVYVTGTFVMLREDGAIALIKVNGSGGWDSDHLIWGGIYWHNTANNSSINGNLNLENTLDGSSSTNSAKNILGNIIDLQVCGNHNEDYFRVTLINNKGQGFIIPAHHHYKMGDASWKSARTLLPHKSVSFDTESIYFKKTVKFHTFYHWHLQEFADGTTAMPYHIYAFYDPLDKFSGSDPYATVGHYKYFNDVFDGELNSTENGFTLYNANIDNLPKIKKYYGPLILLHDDTIVPGIAFGRTANTNVSSDYRYNNWNHAEYGIYGTSNGYTSGEYPAYGDISNVKSIYHGDVTNKYTGWVVLLKNGNVLTWGKSDIGNSRDVSNQLVNVTKIVCTWNSAAALKSDGSVIVWGKSDEGGTFDANTAGSTNTMSNNTLNSGVLDIFASKYGFTAVKSDGIIVWGKYKDYYGDTANLSWSKNSKYIFRSENYSSYPKTINGLFDNTGYNKNNKRNNPLYSTTATQNTIISNLSSLGVGSGDINLLRISTGVEDIKYVTISSTIFSSGDKNDIRNKLIDFLFSVKDSQTKFNKKAIKLNLENKINKKNVDIIKPNLGYFELLDYKYIFKGFYSKMVENDYIVLKALNDDLFFKITKNNTDYTVEKTSGTVDLSLNKVAPYNEGSSVEVNGFKIKFFNGVLDGSDELEKKYNCIECSLGAAAYLDKSVGRVITWGDNGAGGYSHDDFHETGRDTVTAYNNPGATLSSNVVSIVHGWNGFAALKSDGSVVVWGNGGGSNLLSSTEAFGVAENLTSGVASIYGCPYGFGALKHNGDFYCWGYNPILGASGRHTFPAGQFPVKNVAKAFSGYNGFMLLKTDGSLSGIGKSTMGHTPSYLSNANTYETNNFTQGQFTDNDALQNVSKIYTSKECHVVILNDACGNQIKIIGNTSNGKYFANAFQTRRWRTVVVSDHNKFAAIDVSGGVAAWGHTGIVNGGLNNITSGHWMDIGDDVSANVTRIVANKFAWMCLRSDNVLVSIKTGTTGSGDKSYDFENTDNNYKKPPQKYIISKYKLRNIKDIFASETGFGAIDVSDNVVCWGYNKNEYVNEVPHDNTSYIYGGDLSGNDISKNRPVALFSNGLNWCCLKEDETIVTWDKSGYNDSDHGSNHLHTTHGVNSTMWGGNGTSVDGNAGGVRNGDGTIKVTGNVKNIVPFNTSPTDKKRGYIAIQEDSSGNQSCVGWGGYSGPRYNQSTPDDDERSFRHIVGYLTSHSPYQIGFDITGMGADNRWTWLRSNNANLHEYEEGFQVPTGDDTGFGAPVKLVEVYDQDSVIQDASNSGIDAATIEKFKQEDTKLSEDVDEIEAVPTEDNVFADKITTVGKTRQQVDKERIQTVKLAFAFNPKRTKFKVTADLLGFSTTASGSSTAGNKRKAKKSNYVMYKVSFGKATINLQEDKSLDNNTGFYVPLEDGNEVDMTNKNGLAFKIKRDETPFPNGDGKYFVEATGATIPTIINHDSITYKPGSNPQGPFRDGDAATIAGVHIDFSSISEGTGNYSFGDPYLKPIFGGITKLPDKKATYRLFQGKSMYINGFVDKISSQKQENMEQWFYNKTGYDSKLFGFVTSGYFYSQIFIHSENKSILFDFDKSTIKLNSNDKDYFKITNNYEREKDNSYLLNAKCNKYTISWQHDNYTHIKFMVKIYENPQIDNSVSIEVASNISDCKGLLVRNYRPSLMEIPDIKTLQYKKLKKRLKRAKNKYSTAPIKKKNEIWVNM